MVTSEKIWPKPGETLIHHFRSRSKVVEGEVVEVDKNTGKITIRVGRKVYSSLSAAAADLSGYPANGWVFWGLKKVGK